MRWAWWVPVVASWEASSVAVMSPMPSTATTTKLTMKGSSAGVYLPAPSQYELFTQGLQGR